MLHTEMPAQLTSDWRTRFLTVYIVSLPPPSFSLLDGPAPGAALASFAFKFSKVVLYSFPSFTSMSNPPSAPSSACGLRVMQPATVVTSREGGSIFGVRNDGGEYFVS